MYFTLNSQKNKQGKKENYNLYPKQNSTVKSEANTSSRSTRLNNIISIQKN